MVHQEVVHLQEANVAAEVVALRIKTMLLDLLLTREEAKIQLGAKEEEAREEIAVEVLVEAATQREEGKRR